MNRCCLERAWFSQEEATVVSLWLKIGMPSAAVSRRITDLPKGRTVRNFLALTFVLCAIAIGPAAAKAEVAAVTPPKFDNIIEEKAPFPGRLYRPKDNLTHPAIILLHGSEGGNGDYWKPAGFDPKYTGDQTMTAWMARYYASQGFVAYAVCYFDCRKQPGFASYPPDELIDVNLVSVTYIAMEWLKNSSFVKGKPLALWGGSRGAEQALILSSQLGLAAERGIKMVQPDVVIAESPSDFIAGALSKADANATDDAVRPNAPISLAWKFGNAVLTPGSPIAVEHIKGRILITHGAHDEIWGPQVNIDNLTKRMTAAKMPVVTDSFSNTESIPKLSALMKAQLSKKPNANIVFLFKDEGHNVSPASPSGTVLNGLEGLVLRGLLTK